VRASADTIAAIATGTGVGGIGVVRVSGPLAVPIGHALSARELEPRRATLVTLRDALGATLDHGIAIAFKAPFSFTGEDVLELHGHGGRAVLALLLEACLAAGARLARPGEFTERAYLNDKLDLAQAEAVADLISASSATQARAAVRSLEGAFSVEVSALTAELIALRVWIEAALDFPDEEIEFLRQAQLGVKLSAFARSLAGLQARAERGTRLTDGLSVAIIGAPNAGKSSLLNALTRRDAAIVSAIAGTTRDVLREDIAIDGIPLRLVDTAGLRLSADPIEQEGIKRAYAEIERADLILLVVDATAPLSTPVSLPSSTPILTVYNKSDLLPEWPLSDADRVSISALTGAGLAQLNEAIKHKAGLSGDLGGDFSARQRHLDALARAGTALALARAHFEHNLGSELIAEELRFSQNHLSEITGAFGADDLLGEIFSSFCIGK